MAAKNKIEKIFEKTSEKISPTPKEAKDEREQAVKIAKKLQNQLGKKARVMFIGSSARDTGLKGDKDIDLFVLFPRKLSKQQITSKTFTATKKAIKAKWITRYAEHPYLQANVGNFKVEVIPCFQTRPNAPLKSAVDRSPLHMKYLQERLSETQKRDVRVLKQLLKNAQIYGAELEIEGFSGLVCEQLILNYRSLKTLLEHASNWHPPIVIDIENAYTGDAKAALKKFPNAPLVLIDAIDFNRNAAAAISATNISKFISLSRAFITAPSDTFFFQKPPTHSKTKTSKAFSCRSTTLFAIKAPKPNVIDDILFPQLRKSVTAICKQLSRAGFRVYDFTSFADEKNTYILLELEEATLPKVKIFQGPPVAQTTSTDAFTKASLKDKNLVRGPYIKGDRVFADKTRLERKAKNILQKILKKPSKYGVASHVAKAFKKAKILQDKNALFSCNSKQALQRLGNYLLKKEWWI
ncbi:MAG: CCA tRNA nucleotidyltransferase [Candidatus Micrarchaeia archaeon]